MENADYREVVKAAVLEEQTFIKLILSKPLGRHEAPWTRITVRPVLVKGERVVQFSYFDGKKDITSNFSGGEAEARLDEALAMPFGQAHVQATSGDLQVRISRKGSAAIKRMMPSRHEDAPVLSHDRTKDQPLPPNTKDPFLRAARIVNKSGKMRAAMRGKFNQINEFLRIIDQVLGPDARPGPVRIADCGCGSAVLTFGAYHYLNHVRKTPARVVGMDTNEELIGKCLGLRDSLGWDGIEFHVSSIADFVPDEPTDIVLSLHACDTATDEAIAQGIKWGSGIILAAPCCQHELNDQLRSELLRAVLRHGILRERQADIVTDAFRALALRIMGYGTSVIEFVSPESTSKNLMIRAERGPKPGDADCAREYADLKDFWGVTPAIERMLGEEFKTLLKSR